jgi:lysine decarboxylase
VPGLAVLDGPHVDAAKLVVLLPGTGADGVAVESDLLDAGFPVEMADRDTIVAIVTIADDPADAAAFVDAMAASVERRRGTPRAVAPGAAWTVEPEQVVPPREAFFAPQEAVPVTDAVGRVAAELVAPYPPGVPVLAPGERVTADALEALLAAQNDGVRIAYAADPTLATLQVLRA